MQAYQRSLIVTLGAGATLAVAAAVFGFRPTPSAADRVDFGVTVTPTNPAYDAAAPAPSRGGIKDFRIPITHDTITIADGVTYAGWTFGGTVPGPVIRVRQGDSVMITLVNQAPMAHSIDFHAARIPMNLAYKTIAAGDSLSFAFRADDPGVFLVHCGTPPVLLHIMQGMYLAIIVDPAGGWGTKVDREFVLVQSEFYPQAVEAGAPREPDLDAALAKQPTYVVFNGRAFQYQRQPLRVTEGDRVRLFVVNAGPNFTSDFHVVGAIFNRVYPDGDPNHALESVQTYPIPAGGGAVFETVFEKGKSGAGKYAFVTHAFADASKGAVGLIEVTPPREVAAR